MTATAVAPRRACWSDNLVRRSPDGHEVVVAGASDRHDVLMLLSEMLRSSRGSGDGLSAPQLADWVDCVLASHLWLVLLLRNKDGNACGIAVSEYIAYDVDLQSRVLKCKQFYVRPRAHGSLFARSRLLLEAILEAGRRSPKLRDVFIVSTGAPAHARIGRLLQRYGFRRIGTQHAGPGRSCASWSHAEIRELASVKLLGPRELEQLRALARAFYVESVRSSLGAVDLDFERIFQAALPESDPCSVAYLAYRDGQIAGFISARSGSPPLSTRRYLQSTYFYVAPRWRASGLGLKLVDALAVKARSLALDGVFLGTSSGIDCERVCRLLHLLGYAHCGDVLAARLAGERP